MGKYFSESAERRVENEAEDVARMKGSIHHGQRSAHAAAPKRHFLHLETLTHIVHHASNVSRLLFSVSQVLPFAFSAAGKVKGHQIDGWRNELCGLHFVPSVAVKVKDSGKSFEVVGENDAREAFVVLIGDCEKLVVRRSSAELALN